MIRTTSVVIPTLNEVRHVGHLLSDIERQTRRPDEVIVADAGSRDGTVAVAERHPGVTLVPATPPVARGRTEGHGRRHRIPRRRRAAAGDVPSPNYS